MTQNPMIPQNIPMIGLPPLLFNFEHISLVSQYTEIEAKDTDISFPFRYNEKIEIPIIYKNGDILKNDKVVCVSYFGSDETIKKLEILKMKYGVIIRDISFLTSFFEYLEADVPVPLFIFLKHENNAHSKNMIEMIDQYFKLSKDYYETHIKDTLYLIVGNIQTGAECLIDFKERFGDKIDCFATSEVDPIFGYGVPCLSALQSLSDVIGHLNLSSDICCMHNFKSSSEIIKALAFGANFVIQEGNELIKENTKELIHYALQLSNAKNIEEFHTKVRYIRCK